MNKSATYVFLLFTFLGVLLFFSLYNSYGHEISFEKNGLQFETMGLHEIINPSNYTHVIVAKDQKRNGKTVLLFEGYLEGSKRKYKVHNLPEEDVRSDNDIFYDAISGAIDFREETKILNTDEVVLKWTSRGNYSYYAAKKLVQYNSEAGWFGFFDDSPFIFVLFIFFAFLIIYVLDLVSRLLQLKEASLIKLVIYLLIILGVIYLLSEFRIVEWYLNSMFGKFLKYAVASLPIFFLFQIIIKPALRNLDFVDQELVKFLTFSVGLFLFLWIGIYVGLNIDGLRLTNVVHLTHNYLPNQFSIGLILAFVLGNLINNIRKNIIDLSKSKKQVAVFRKQANKFESEIEALQSSINPHFLYNSLNSIASLAPTDGPKTEQMAISLSSFYKYVNNKQEDHLSSLSQEIEMIKNYIDIEKIRFGDRLEVIFDIDPKTESIKIPRFTLQPLVENAIKYGYRSGKIQVKISTLMNENELLLMVFDDGRKFGESLSLGFGLRSISKKLAYMFPEKHSLEFINEPEKHVFISITIPDLDND